MPNKYILISPNVSPYSKPLKCISSYEILSRGMRCSTEWGVAPLAKNLNPPEGTENLFRNVTLSDGAISLEFCIELPETLSSPAENAEDWIEKIRLSDGDVLEVGLSNQMAFYYHWIGDAPYVAITRRINAGEIRKGEHSSGCAPRLAHTMACIRRKVYCDSPYNAMCEHIESMRDDLIEAVQKLSLAHLQVDGRNMRSSYPLYDRSVFEHGYLGVYGSNETAASAQLWINPNKSALQSYLSNQDDVNKISNLLTDGFDSNDTNRLLLPLAKASLSAGVTHYAFIAAFIFAETLCSSVCKHKILRRGVSSAKYSKSSRDITSSIAINILLKSLFDTPPPDHVLSTLDTSRRLRNELMHDGSMNIDSKVVNQLISACEELQSWANYHVFEI